MSKIIRLTESDLTRIVRRVLNEQIVDPKNQSNVASTTSVNKLPTTGGPKPVDLVPKGCLKGYVMDKSQKFYQKIGEVGYDKRKVYPSGKWSERDGSGQSYGYGYNPSDAKVEWGTWKCSGDKILFDRPELVVGKEVFLDNGDSFSDNSGGSYSVTASGHQSLSGKIISKTPAPQFNTYEIKVKGPAGCATTMVDYLVPKGKNFYEVTTLEVGKC